MTDKARLEEEGLSPKDAMDTVLQVWGDMIFKWGWVHCRSPSETVWRAQSD